MTSIWSGALVVGKVSVPIGVSIAASREGLGISVKLLHAKCKTPVSQKRRCETCKVELAGNAEVVSGYEFAKGHFAIFEAGELEAALNSKTITLDRFIRVSELDPVLIDRTHWVSPAKDVFAEMAYAVIERALRASGLGGVGRIVLGTRELPCLVTVHQDEQVLMLQTLFTVAEVRRPVDIWKRVARHEIPVAAVELATEALTSRSVLRFSSRRMDTWLKRRLPEVVAKKAAGGKVAVPVPANAAPLDLEAALRASLKRTKSKAKEPA